MTARCNRNTFASFLKLIKDQTWWASLGEQFHKQFTTNIGTVGQEHRKAQINMPSVLKYVDWKVASSREAFGKVVSKYGLLKKWNGLSKPSALQGKVN